MVGELVRDYTKRLPYVLLEADEITGLTLHRDTETGHIIYGRNGVVFDENNIDEDNARYHYHWLQHEFEGRLI